MKTRSLENIKVETDDTDHFRFICPDCGTAMTVSDCYTKTPGSKTLTYFILRCGTCGGGGVRKILHNP